MAQVGDILVWKGGRAFWRIIGMDGSAAVGKLIGPESVGASIGWESPLVPLSDPGWMDEFEVFVRQTREEANCS